MPTSIDHRDVQRLLAEQQAQLVEVLPAAEYEDEHLPGAVNIPLKELDRQTIGDSDARAGSFLQQTAADVFVRPPPSAAGALVVIPISGL
jgi:rhodanese-related sulfurtransferase